jgi:uncharacterized protein YdaT
MKIAILAWGSLLWEKGNLALRANWAPGGPELPLEFSRVSESRDGALTLVIDPKNGVEIPAYFAVSAHQNLDTAIRNLHERERTRSKFIGYVNCSSGQSRSSILPTASSKIREWAGKNNFDAVIWTDLPSNFDDVDKAKFSDVDEPSMKFTVDNAQKYLHCLKARGAAKAREYIKKAPPEVETELRKRMRSDPWLDK